MTDKARPTTRMEIAKQGEKARDPSVCTAKEQTSERD